MNGYNMNAKRQDNSSKVWVGLPAVAGGLPPNNNKTVPHLQVLEVLVSQESEPSVETKFNSNYLSSLDWRKGNGVE